MVLVSQALKHVLQQRLGLPGVVPIFHMLVQFIFVMHMGYTVVHLIFDAIKSDFLIQFCKFGSAARRGKRAAAGQFGRIALDRVVPIVRCAAHPQLIWTIAGQHQDAKAMSIRDERELWLELSLPKLVQQHPK